MLKSISPKTIALTFGVLTVSFVAVFYAVAWTEPSQTPPQGNVATPLNVSSAGQIKTGNLVVNALGISGTGSNIFSMTYGAGAGKVLTSDALGAASWQTPSRGGVYVGATPGSYNGLAVSGYSGGDAKCAAAYPGSRMCVAADFASIRPTARGWYNTFTYSVSSWSTQTYVFNDCFGWTTDSPCTPPQCTYYYGTAWDPELLRPVYNAGCGGEEHILCCK